MPAGFMIPARHVPPLMARHTKAGYTTSSGLSLAQPNMAEGQFDMSQTADSEIAKIREEEFESKSGSDNIEGASGEDQDGERRPRKKRYHRHTQHQIQEMEMFFKECPHPDDKQRKELSRELGLEPLQVKFWFQNKRTQMKHFKARELGMLARCLCVPLVSIRVGKVIKQGSLLCPTSTRK